MVKESTSLAQEQRPQQRALWPEMPPRAVALTRWLLSNPSPPKHKRLHHESSRVPGAGAWLTALPAFRESHTSSPLFLGWLLSSPWHASQVSLKIGQRISCTLHRKNARDILTRAPAVHHARVSSVMRCLLTVGGSVVFVSLPLWPVVFPS